MAIDRIQLRRGTAAEWADSNRVLADGEPGFERDTGKIKYGNGVSPWSVLPYASQGPEGPPGASGVADDASMQGLIADPDSATRGALNATYLPKWKATTEYLAGAQVVAPTGETVSAKVDFTSGATFSAGNWNFPAASGGGIPAWAPSTAYAINAKVISPNGTVVYANAAFTSGATFDPTNWTASQAFASGGVHLVVSDTQPAQPTVDGRPVVLLMSTGSTIQWPITVTASAPTFTDLAGTASDTYTIPTRDGVDYQVGGVTKVPGVYPASGTVTITAVGKPGYAVSGPASWSNTFSTYQPVWVTLTGDDFTGTDNAALLNRATSGGQLWKEANATSAVISTNRAGTLTDSNVPQNYITLTTIPTRTRVSATYDLASASPIAGLALGVDWKSNNYASNNLKIRLSKNGALVANSQGSDNALTALSGTTTGHPTTGTLSVDFNPAAQTYAVSVNGAQVATGAMPGMALPTAPKVYFDLSYAGARADDFLVESYQ